MSSKTERLINLIAMLSETMRPLTQQEIITTIPGYNSNKSTARRTFERDKDELRKLGFDILSLPTPTGDYGYSINKENTFYSVSLSPKQRNIVQCAIALYSPDADISSKSLTKLGGTNPENDLNSVVSLSAPKNLNELFKFCSTSADIEFNFKESKRRVRTRKLLAKGGYWYLESIDLDKKEIRNFRIDRLSNIKEIKNVNIDINEIEKYVLDKNDFEDSIEIVVSVEPHISQLFIKDWNGHVLENGDISFKVPRLEIFLLRYFDYSGYVQVISPPDLKEKVDIVLEDLLTRLGGNVNAS